MRFGEYLESKKAPEWADQYIDYKKLKGMIKALSSKDSPENTNVEFDRSTSLTTKKRDGRQSKTVQAEFRGNIINESSFFTALEAEMARVDRLIHEKQKVIKAETEAIEVAGDGNSDCVDEERIEEYSRKAKELGDRFLSLEKFVNLNYLGFHKILKKHDKHSSTPCRKFYLTRLHSQRWIKNDYSKLFVELSRIHSMLRGDRSGKNENTGAQHFVRTTTKYWVSTENVSRVKHTILQHLPVFQHDIDALAGDSQFCSSVYFDNTRLELYHGRLDKTPDAIAIRFRWYATPLPELVFVERKTHNDSWTGALSVKERFTLLEHQVIPFLRGEYTVDDKIKEMQTKNASEADIQNTVRLFTEIYQQIESKQLQPTMRTVYNRAAYQVPFDPTVRISLDNNLSMISENPRVGPDCATEGRWYRNPNLILPPTDITRFPHAVLEVKLSLKEGEDAPEWVQSLITSNLCTQVHKFSKFIHGCATLLPEQVQAFPYWMDDISIRPSILRSQPQTKRRTHSTLSSSKFARGLRGQIGLNSVHKPIRIMERNYSQVLDPEDEFSGGGVKQPLIKTDPLTVELSSKPRKTPMKIEPKVFFANERTLLSWLSISITLGVLSTALLGFTDSVKGNSFKIEDSFWAHLAGIALMPLSIGFAVYAYFVFTSRRKYLKLRIEDGQFFDEVGPFWLGIVLMATLSVIFCSRL